jgi:type IV pilus assembly protein PilE
MAMPASARFSPRRTRGMTLIEVMIAVVIVGVLTAIALPAYQSSVRKGRRAEAFTALAGIQQGQERWRGSHTNYTTTLADARAVSPTPSGYYTLALAAPADPATLASGYVATATAAGAQVADTSCATLAVRMLGGNLSYGSGNGDVDWTDPGRCWAK